MKLNIAQMADFTVKNLLVEWRVMELKDHLVKSILHSIIKHHHSSLLVIIMIEIELIVISFSNRLLKNVFSFDFPKSNEQHWIKHTKNKNANDYNEFGFVTIYFWNNWTNLIFRTSTTVKMEMIDNCSTTWNYCGFEKKKEKKNKYGIHGCSWREMQSNELIRKRPFDNNGWYFHFTNYSTQKTTAPIHHNDATKNLSKCTKTIYN